MRKNILILGHNYVSQFIDIVNQYSRVFDRNQYEVTVAYLTGAPDDEVKKQTLAEHILFLNIPKKKIRYLKIAAIKTLLALCREKKFDMVICHRYKPTYIMLWVAQFCSIPQLIFVMHELRTMSHRSRQLCIALLKRRNMLFAGVSNAVRDDMRKHLWCVPKDRIITLYNMIDIDLMEPQLLSKEAARQALGLAMDAIVFGNVARLVPNKDQTTLLRAFAQIQATCSRATLIIIGTGADETALKSAAQALGIADSVIFTGYLVHGFKYMKAFDCFVLSSIQEAFGRVLIEAMIAKLPIIATSVHGIPEVVADANSLVPARDVDALAAKMKNVYAMNSDERSELGEKSYEHALEKFSITTFRKQFWSQVPLSRLRERGQG